MITVLLVRFPQEKVLILIVATFLNAKARNRTMKQVDSKTNRMVMIGLYSKGTDGQMYTSSFILCEILITTYFWRRRKYNAYLYQRSKINKRTSKSVYDRKETNNLFICNMMTYSTRKVLYEKVQIDATVRDLHSLNLAKDDVSKVNL